MKIFATETSGAEVTIYTQSGPIQFHSEYGANAGEFGQLAACETSKALGAPSGTFSLTIKPNPHQKDLRLILSDDDWVDIVFTRHGRPFHVMRGLIDSIRRSEGAPGGATSITYAIIGRDASKIFDCTPLWYNTATAVNVGNAQQLQIFDTLSLAGNHPELMEKILIRWLKQFQGLKQGQWAFPSGMPNTGGATFADTISINSNHYDDSLNQTALTPADAQGQETSLLAFAMQWSDPVFMELIFDTYLDGDPVKEGEILANSEDPCIPLSDTKLGIIVRDKPFPTLEKQANSDWYSLPKHVIERQHIQSTDLVRSGDERKNAFFVSPAFPNEATSTSMDLFVPDWSPSEIARHGLRRFDVTTPYSVSVETYRSDKDSLGLISRTLRSRVADWMCMNGEFYSGQISTARMYPEIRIGSRVRIPHPDEALEENYYCEQVTHSWAPVSGGSTRLGVTRGFLGTETSYLTRLGEIRETYESDLQASTSSELSQAASA